MFDSTKRSSKSRRIFFQFFRQYTMRPVAVSRVTALVMVFVMFTGPFSLWPSFLAASAASPRLGIALLPSARSDRLSGRLAITAPRAVFNPYWYADEKTTATLEITNNSDVFRTLFPALLLRGLERFSLDPVTVAAGGTVRISINAALNARLAQSRGNEGPDRWGDGSRRRSLWGAALLEGESTAGISSWIISESPDQSLSINSLFGDTRIPSPTLASSWWLPTEKTSAFFALQNAGDTDLILATLVYLNGRLVPGNRITLPTGGARLVDLREILRDDGFKKKPPEVGVVQFFSSEAGHPFVGRAVMVDEEQGFSVPLATHTTLSMLGGTLQMPGTMFGRPDEQMGFPKGVRFSPQLLLTNTSASPLHVTATIDGASGNGKALSWSAPTFHLDPHEARVFDLEKTRTANHAPIADGFSGVRLTHDGKALDLYADIVTVDQSLSFSFYDPFFDENRSGNTQHAISFNLSGNKRTLLIVKNTDKELASLSYAINYEENGSVHSYSSVPVTLQPNEARVVDLKALRDNQVADSQGRTLPATATFGNATIYSDRKVLVAGDPTYDPVAGTCFSCVDPCLGGEQIQLITDVDPCASPFPQQKTLACISCCEQADMFYSDDVKKAEQQLGLDTAFCVAAFCIPQGFDSIDCVDCLTTAGINFVFRLEQALANRDARRVQCHAQVFNNGPNCNCPC